MCTLCGATGTVEVDEQPAATATAMVWAVHFRSDHPDVPGGVSRHLVMTPREPQ